MNSNSDKKTSVSKEDTTKIENPGPVNKKRKTVTKSSSSASNDSSTKDKTSTNTEINGYTKFSLSDIKQSLESLHKLVPPDSMPDNTKESVRDWSRQMQAVLEEFNLLIACVSSSTYKWGTDRSGAADQNLSLLFSEINSAQDQISSSVTTRISNVLAPVIDIVISKSTKRTNIETGEDIKTNEFSRNLVDPEYVRMCELSVHRNARMLRQVILANFHKVEMVMGDYIQANKKDGQTNHNAFSY